MLVQVGIYIVGGHLSAVKGSVATLVSVIHVYSPKLVIIKIKMCEDINL